MWGLGNREDSAELANQGREEVPETEYINNEEPRAQEYSGVAWVYIRGWERIHGDTILWVQPGRVHEGQGAKDGRSGETVHGSAVGIQLPVQ